MELKLNKTNYMSYTSRYGHTQFTERKQEFLFPEFKFPPWAVTFKANADDYGNYFIKCRDKDGRTVEYRWFGKAWETGPEYTSSDEGFSPLADEYSLVESEHHSNGW